MLVVDRTRHVWQAALRPGVAHHPFARRVYQPAALPERAAAPRRAPKAHRTDPIERSGTAPNALRSPPERRSEGKPRNELLPTYMYAEGVNVLLPCMRKG